MRKVHKVTKIYDGARIDFTKSTCVIGAAVAAPSNEEEPDFKINK